MHLTSILNMQKEAIQVGLTNPEKIYNALAKLTQNAGFKNPEEFWVNPANTPEQEGADVVLDNNEQTKAVAEEKIEVAQEEKPTIEVKEEKVEEKKPLEKKVETKRDDLEEYSESVKKRIAKLTHKIREAERQKEEAVSYAQSVKKEKEQIESRLSRTDQQ